MTFTLNLHIGIDDQFGLPGLDHVLMGQGIVPKAFVDPFLSLPVWQARLQAWRNLVEKSLPRKEALEVLVHHPGFFPGLMNKWKIHRSGFLLLEQLKQFGPEIEPTKTLMLEFGPGVTARAKHKRRSFGPSWLDQRQLGPRRRAST